MSGTLALKIGPAGAAGGLPGQGGTGITGAPVLGIAVESAHQIGRRLAAEIRRAHHQAPAAIGRPAIALVIIITIGLGAHAAPGSKQDPNPVRQETASR